MIFEKIKELIVDQLSISNPSIITPSTSLEDDLDADSLDAVELIMSIEDEFDLEIPDETAEKFQYISDIIEYIENYK